MLHDEQCSRHTNRLWSPQRSLLWRCWYRLYGKMRALFEENYHPTMITHDSLQKKKRNAASLWVVVGITIAKLFDWPLRDSCGGVNKAFWAPALWYIALNENALYSPNDCLWSTTPPPLQRYGGFHSKIRTSHGLYWYRSGG